MTAIDYCHHPTPGALFPRFRCAPCSLDGLSSAGAAVLISLALLPTLKYAFFSLFAVVVLGLVFKRALFYVKSNLNCEVPAY